MKSDIETITIEGVPPGFYDEVCKLAHEFEKRGFRAPTSISSNPSSKLPVDKIVINNGHFIYELQIEERYKLIEFLEAHGRRTQSQSKGGEPHDKEWCVSHQQFSDCMNIRIRVKASDGTLVIQSDGILNGHGTACILRGVAESLEKGTMKIEKLMRCD